jgi:hypothetical protein
LTNYVNGISYPENYIFQIEGVHNNEPHTSGFTKDLFIGNLNFSDLEHGMKIKGGEVVKKITTDNISNKQSLYFLHITKTSGISLQSELKEVFKGEKTFVNNIQYVNHEDMLNSKLISGHFAMHPFLLYKNNNKKLNGVTIIRNPIDRAISYFVFKYNITDIMFGFKTKKLTSKNFDNFLSDEKNLNYINNYQTKTMTSDLDLSKSLEWSQKYIDSKISRLELISAQSLNYNFMDFKNSENLWKDSLINFNVIGCVDKRDLFLEKTSEFLQKNNYNAKLKDIKKNESNFKVEEIKKILTADQIEKVISLNNYDFELYDFIMSRNGVLEC